MPVSTEQCFAKVVGSLRAASNTHGRVGGALSSKCSDVGEIFRIAVIMNGLVLGLLLDLYSSELKRGSREMSECIV
jgi:hypothetical protein